MSAAAVRAGRARRIAGGRRMSEFATNFWMALMVVSLILIVDGLTS